MIKSLKVRNYALIDELNLDLKSGFTALSGETGAGKSILLGAMQLALGARADLKALRDPELKCVVEMVVDLSNYDLRAYFEEEDLDYEAETIIRREVLPNGKSRAFINDSPVRLDVLQPLADQLIDIHSQHDTLLLRDGIYPLTLLDQLAGNDELIRVFKINLAEWKKALSDLRLLEAEATGGKDIDYIKFLADELREAKIESGEEERVEEELKELQHVEDIGRGLSEALSRLDGELAAVNQISSAIHALDEISKFHHHSSEWSTQLKSALLEVQDVVANIEGNIGSLESDPNRLQWLDDRLSLIQNLKHKHRVESADDLAALLVNFDETIERHLNMEVRLESAKSRIVKAENEVEKASNAITKSRASVIPQVVKAVEDMLAGLNMASGKFEMLLSESHQFHALGKDEVTLMFSANAGQRLQPLGKIASGGELSRLMLALKALMARSQGLPTIVFDEIDTGISGETARRVAEILREMGKELQVIAITHLPQIAAAGTDHIKIFKIEEGGRTYTKLNRLSKDERVLEIARLVSGENPGEAAVNNAKELLASMAS